MILGEMVISQSGLADRCLQKCPQQQKLQVV